MKSKDYLAQVIAMNREINDKIDQLAHLKAMTTSMGGGCSEPVRHSRNIHRIEDIIAKAIDLEAEIDNMIDDYVDFKAQVIILISRIDDDNQRKVLYLRYVEGKTIGEISAELNRKSRATKYIHAKALKKCDMILHKI